MKTKNNTISTIVYEKNQIPVFIEVRKKIIKFFFFLFPISTFILLFALIAVLANFQYIRSFMQQKEPKIITELKLKNIELNQQINLLDTNLKEFEERLASSDTSEVELFSVFKKPANQKDLTEIKSFEIESLQITEGKSDITVSFNLKNIKEEIRQSGYIFLVMQEKGSFQIYPKDQLPPAGEKLAFNMGESFITYRFRPVNATFTRLDAQTSPIFTVIVFNKVGDLIHKEILKQ